MYQNFLLTNFLVKIFFRTDVKRHETDFISTLYEIPNNANNITIL